MTLLILVVSTAPTMMVLEVLYLITVPILFVWNATQPLIALLMLKLASYAWFQAARHVLPAAVVNVSLAI